MSDSQFNGQPRVIGSITGWKLITTDVDPDSYPDHAYTFTTVQLMELITKFLSQYSPQRLAEIEKALSDHFTQSNPHQTRFDDLMTDVINELYKEWKLYTGDPDGSSEEFLKILFQYIPVADIPTVLEGTANDKVVSVMGLEAKVNHHNTNKDAHETLITHLFPGAKIPLPPAFAAYGSLGLFKYVEVTRASSMWYTDNLGDIREAPENTMPRDFTYKQGVFPVFGTVTGSIRGNARPQLTPGNWTQMNVTGPLAVPVDSEDIVPILADGTPLGGVHKVRLIESTDVSPVTHGVSYEDPAVTWAINDWYTVSMIVRDHRKSENASIQISVPGAFGALGTYAFMNYNLTTGRTFKNEAIADDLMGGGIQKLKNDQYRIWLTFSPQVSSTLQFNVTSLDIIDGDDNYVATGALTFDILYPQVTNTNQVSPLIINTDPAVEPLLAATYLKLPLTGNDKIPFNPVRGTFAIRTTPPVGEVQVNNRYLFDFASDTASIMIGRFAAIHRKRLFFSWNNNTGVSIVSAYGAVKEDTDFTTFAMSYAPDKIVYGSTGQAVNGEFTIGQPVGDEVNVLYIGGNKDMVPSGCLNGYIASFVYYPEACNKYQLNGYTEGEI